MESQPVNSDGVYRDRSTGLVVFGVIEILLGVFSALLVPVSLVAERLSSDAANLWSKAPVMAVYGVTAAGFIWLGIGSIRARRWACDLTLAISRIWLVTGIGSMVVSAFALPAILGGSGAAESLPTDVLLVVSGVVVAVLGLFYVVLPAAFVLFYRSPDVVATCRARDPGERFTEGCPPRLLTLAVVWGLGAVSVPAMSAYGWVLPFFGTVVSGVQGAAGWIVVLVVCGTLAWGSFRRRRWAWWGAVAATVAAAVSTTLTSIRVSPTEIMRSIPFGDDQRMVLESIAWPEPWIMALLWIALWASMLAYLLSVRSAFFDSGPPGDD